MPLGSNPYFSPPARDIKHYPGLPCRGRLREEFLRPASTVSTPWAATSSASRAPSVGFALKVSEPPAFTSVIQDNVDGFKSLSLTPTGWGDLASKKRSIHPSLRSSSRRWHFLRVLVVLSMFSPLNASGSSSTDRLKNGHAMGTRTETGLLYYL